MDIQTNNTVEQLNEAEKKANALIQQAQEQRKKIVQKAKEAGKSDIEALQKQKEKNFNEVVKPRFTNVSEEQQLEEQTKVEVKQLYSNYEGNSKAAIELLTERVINIQIELPKVVKGMYELEQEFKRKRKQ